MEMGAVNKVRLTICATEYVINTSEEPDYVKGIASEISSSIEAILGKDCSMSLNEAYVLSLLSYVDRYKKAEDNADHMRSQLKDYMEEEARARVELDEAKREIESLRRELNQLKGF